MKPNFYAISPRAADLLSKPMQNVEFKAELRDPDLARAILTRLGATHAATHQQVDTYYRVPNGRLKKRETDSDPPELIYYHRPNVLRPRLSHFTIYTESEARKRFGLLPLPIWLVVSKRREIWLHNNTRVHIDHVEHLGSYLEVEVLVTPDRHVGLCHVLAADIQRTLAPVLGECIAVSYSELMALELETAEEH